MSPLCTSTLVPGLIQVIRLPILAMATPENIFNGWIVFWFAGHMNIAGIVAGMTPAPDECRYPVICATHGADHVV